MAKGIPLKTASSGSCAFSSTSPAQAKLNPNTKVLNVNLSFEEALKFQLAIQQCLLGLNRYDRAKTPGKDMGVRIAVFFEKHRVTVTEQKVI